MCLAKKKSKKEIEELAKHLPQDPRYTILLYDERGYGYMRDNSTIDEVLDYYLKTNDPRYPIYVREQYKQQHNAIYRYWLQCHEELNQYINIEKFDKACQREGFNSLYDYLRINEIYTAERKKELK